MLTYNADEEAWEADLTDQVSFVNEEIKLWYRSADDVYQAMLSDSFILKCSPCFDHTYAFPIDFWDTRDQKVILNLETTA